MSTIGKLRAKMPSRPELQSYSDEGPPSSSTRKILVVEDTPTDRELVRYLLEARFRSARIYEAATLHAAIAILEHERVDCVILDLQLPDSTGKATFTTLYDRYPDIPLVVMTHNKDRSLAIEMIHHGAADYMIKNFTDEEELFRRIVFAMEKHKVSVRVTSDEAASVHRLDRAQANLMTAHQSGQHTAIQTTTVEVTAAIADISRRMFAEMSTVSNQVTQIATNQTNLSKVVDNLDQELLRGQQGRPSMRSQVDLLDHRLTTLEDDVQASKTKKANEIQDKMSNRTKIILAILALVGTLAGTFATYEAAIHATHDAGVK